MSGIAAVFDRTGAGPDPDRLHQMVSAMEHRGPDGSGEWSNDIVGIGHQQLVTTPQGTVDDQPYTHDGLAVASDARLDNRPELLRRLGLTDVSRTVPDSHLLLEAYREWGDGCVNELIGAFAFVVWDSSKKTLFCARDHFGVKPLYYHITDDVFAVASEPKSLLTLPGFTPSLDESRVGDFLLGRLEDKTNSFYESVRRLPCPSDHERIPERLLAFGVPDHIAGTLGVGLPGFGHRRVFAVPLGIQRKPQ